MSTPKNQRRYVVADLGFSFAVHDTQAPQDYAFEAGKDSEHISTNQLNSVRVGLFPTREEAVRAALELNEAHERRAG